MEISCAAPMRPNFMNAWRPLATRQQNLATPYEANSFAVATLQYNGLFNPIQFPYGTRYPAPFRTTTFANQLCTRFPGDPRVP